MASLMINIPVHEEEGWTCPSPESSAELIARLEAKDQGKKSPEQLKKAEDYARLLRQAHVDAVAARARRENERAAEAKSRRLRNEANAKQRLQQRLNAVAERQAWLEHEKAQKEQEKAAQRNVLMAAVKDARAAQKEAIEHRHENKLERVASAVSSREQRLKDIIQRNAWVVKRALAIATAVKERERDTSAAKAEQLDLRLAAAAGRRELEQPRSPRTEERLRASRWALATRALELECKRRTLEKAQESATEKREAQLSSVRQRASDRNAKISAVAEERKSQEAAADGARRNLFEKLNSAVVKRGLQRRQSAKKLGVDGVIEIEVHSTPLPPAPAALVERLERKSMRKDSEQSAHMDRHSDAARRRQAALASFKKSALRDLMRVREAAAKREACAAERAASLEGRNFRRMASVALARRARTASAMKMIGRVAEAELRRKAADAARKRAIARAVLKRNVAVGQRASILLNLGRMHVKRSEAAATRRAANELSVALRGKVAARACEHAALRRAELIAAKVVRAHVEKRAKVCVKVNLGTTSDENWVTVDIIKHNDAPSELHDVEVKITELGPA